MEYSRSSASRIHALATLLLALHSAVEAADISLGSVLYAANPDSTWLSPRNTFSIGFLSSTASTFITGVNFNGVSVWQAGGAGVVVDSGGALELTRSGDLQLLDGSKRVIWSSNTSSFGVTSASLEDSGNFLLRNGNLTVWSSFDHPTDSVIPSQIFSVNMALRSGRYSLSLNQSGNMTLKWDDNIEYWTLGPNSTYGGNLTSPSLSILAIGTLTVSDEKLSSPATVVYSSDYAEGNSVFRFLRLDSDGNLRIYSVAGTGSDAAVTQRWTAVPDQCQVFGYCGSFGICSYKYSNPVCRCP